MPTIAEGDNYEISSDAHEVVHCRVWRRKDLDSDAGARCAEEMLEHLERLAKSPSTRGFVYDLRDAPGVAGPRTQAAIGRTLTAWSEAGRRTAIVVGEVSLRRLQMQRIVSEHVRDEDGAVFDEPDEAVTWVLSRR
jgi:hypothetical protein